MKILIEWIEEIDEANSLHTLKVKKDYHKMHGTENEYLKKQIAKGGDLVKPGTVGHKLKRHNQAAEVADKLIKQKS